MPFTGEQLNTPFAYLERHVDAIASNVQRTDEARARLTWHRDGTPAWSSPHALAQQCPVKHSAVRVVVDGETR